MFGSLKVGIVVPAFNEAIHLNHVLSGIPMWVDSIVVINDASTDTSAQRLKEIKTIDPKLHVIHHASNKGVGACILEGYRKLFAEEHMDVAVVMAGDGQMDPSDLSTFLSALRLHPLSLHNSGTPPIYIKGNRFLLNAKADMPILRQWGSALFSSMTRWGFDMNVHDTQCGYTAITASAFKLIHWDNAWKRYGYPNDILARCKRHQICVLEVPVHARYCGEKSGLRVSDVLLSIPAVIGLHTAQHQWWKLKQKLNRVRPR